MINNKNKLININNTWNININNTWNIISINNVTVIIP